MSHDQRHEERDYPRRAAARLLVAEHEHPFQILDESEGGLGLYSADSSGLTVGGAVVVRIAERPDRKGIVRYIHSLPFGGFQIGVMFL
jgi:hypothetical protein